MNLWFVKSPAGWTVYDFNGKFVAYETMMCNCKGHSIRLQIPWKRISDRSTTKELNIFQLQTGMKYQEHDERTEESNYY